MWWTDVHGQRYAAGSGILHLARQRHVWAAVWLLGALAVRCMCAVRRDLTLRERAVRASSGPQDKDEVTNVKSDVGLVLIVVSGPPLLLILLQGLLHRVTVLEFILEEQKGNSSNRVLQETT